jgi:ubiquinone biosynthesis protein
MDYIKFLRLPQYFKNITRLTEIIRVLMKHGFSDLIERLHISPYLDVSLEIFGRSVFQYPSRHLGLAERVRLAFEELGPTFVKFAQQLSTRPDIFPDSVTRELKKLQDNVAPFPSTIAIEVVEKAFNKSISEICNEFSDRPVASASMSQVHAVKLLTGEHVVMKIQRPSLKSLLTTDTEILFGLATLLEEHIPESRCYRPIKLVEEFCRVLSLELDFEREVISMERFRESYLNEPLLVIPKVIKEYSTTTVLTQEYIEGEKVDELNNIALSQEERSNLVNMFGHIMLRSIFEEGFFHADPHPGNVLITKNKSIALLDYGAMGRLEIERGLQVLRLLIAIIDRDLDSLVKVLKENQVLPRAFDEVSLKNQINDVLDMYLGRPLGKINLANLLTEIFEVVRKFEISPPPDLLFVARAITSFQYIGSSLDPDFEPISAMRPYLKKRYLATISNPNRYLKNLINTTDAYTKLMMDFPVDARQLLKQFATEEFTLFHQFRDIESLCLHQNKLINRIIISVIGATILVLGVLYKGHNSFDPILRVILMSLGSLLLFLVWRAVKRSGGM